jgi:hypothetical protein
VQRVIGRLVKENMVAKEGPNCALTKRRKAAAAALK